MGKRTSKEDCKAHECDLSDLRVRPLGAERGSKSKESVPQKLVEMPASQVDSGHDIDE